VLDVGCGEGHVGGLLVDAGLRVDGLEPDPTRAEAARAHLPFVRTADLDGAVAAGMPGAPYDAVLFMDVLEHFVDPVDALRTANRLLHPSGKVFALIPNSANWRFRLKVLRGDWRYGDWGLFDRTHLRFFDIRTAVELFADAGMRVDRVTHLTPSTHAIEQRGCRLRPQLFALHTLIEASAAFGAGEGA
jgi:2-polyprenyl-3-methyl-5-hydroxy-6-metoxy-1,4-benzoquinol methylase